MDGKVNLFSVNYNGERGTIGHFYEMDNNDTNVYNRISNICNEALTNKEKVKVIQFSDEDIINFILNTPLEGHEGCEYDFTE